VASETAPNFPDATLHHGAQRKNGRVPELDLLRFIAASAVVIYHFTYRPLLNGEISTQAFGAVQSISRFGYLGVNLFFIISGFVILWSSQGRTASEFVASRFARLYPTFWICVIITTLVLASAGRFSEISPRIVALNLTMVPRLLGTPYLDGVYWTLFVEMKFYALVFAVLLTRTMRYVEWILGAWLVACAAGAIGVSPHWVDSLALAPFGPFFISGCIVYMIRARGASITRVAALLLSGALSVLLAIDQQAEFMQSVTPTSTSTVICVIVGFHAVFLAIAVTPRILPDSRTWYLLGTLTYPLYLLHSQIGKIVLAKTYSVTPLWPALVVALAVVYALAAAVAKVSERRLSKNLHNWLLATLERRAPAAT